MKASDFLSNEELKFFTERSDLRGAWIVAFNWLSIAAIFAAVAIWTNPLTVVLAILLLGGRQMGLAVLMHEAGHKTLFRTQSLNEWIGNWLCAYPVLGDCASYAASHREQCQVDQQALAHGVGFFSLAHHDAAAAAADEAHQQLEPGLAGNVTFDLAQETVAADRVVLVIG